MGSQFKPDSGNHTLKDFAEFLKYVIDPHLAGDEQIRQAMSKMGDQILSIDHGGRAFVAVLMTEEDFAARRVRRSQPKIHRDHPMRDPLKKKER